MRRSAERAGDLQLHSSLVIGHKEKEGVQRVYSHPFANEKKTGKQGRKRGHRQDWCLCARQAMPLADSNWQSTQCGFAKYCSFSPSRAVQILESSCTGVPSYVLPIECILGKLPVVPVGATGTIPFSMRRSAADFVDAAFDSAEGTGDGSMWWYVNTWALGWSREA